MNRPMPIRIVGTTIPATIAPVFELSGDGVVVANCPCKKTEFFFVFFFVKCVTNRDSK